MASSTPVLPKLPSTEAFLHLIYDYRYFSIAAYEWNKITSSGHVLQDKDALVQDALLLHARSLISFYLPSSRSSSTDIVYSDFGLRPLAASRARKLGRYKPSIDVHLMHLTAYRDYAYRRRHISNPSVAERQRPNWNRHNAIIIKELLEVLRISAKSAGQWRPPLEELHAACEARLQAQMSWPAQLGEASQVRRYIRQLQITP